MGVSRSDRLLATLLAGFVTASSATAQPRANEQPPEGLYVYTFATKEEPPRVELLTVSPHPLNSQIRSAAWSPEGDEVALATGPHAGLLYAVAADGTTVRSLGPGERVLYAPNGSALLFINDRSHYVVDNTSETPAVRRETTPHELARLPRESDWGNGHLDPAQVQGMGIPERRTGLERLTETRVLIPTGDPHVVLLSPIDPRFLENSRACRLQSLLEDGNLVDEPALSWGIPDEYGSLFRDARARLSDGTWVSLVSPNHEIEPDGTLGAPLETPAEIAAKQGTPQAASRRIMIGLVRFQEIADAPLLQPTDRIARLERGGASPETIEMLQAVIGQEARAAAEIAPRDRPRALQPFAFIDLRPMWRLVSGGKGGMVPRELVAMPDGSVLLVGRTDFRPPRPRKRSNDTIVRLHPSGDFELLVQAAGPLELHDVAVSRDGRRLAFVSNLPSVLANPRREDPYVEDDFLPAADRLIWSSDLPAEDD